MYLTYLLVPQGEHHLSVLVLLNLIRPNLERHWDGSAIMPMQLHVNVFRHGQSIDRAHFNSKIRQGFLSAKTDHYLLNGRARSGPPTDVIIMCSDHAGRPLNAQ